MNLFSWIRKRSPAFMFERGRSLLKHYGVTPQKAMHRIDELMESFVQFDCSPTFPVPGQVIQSHPEYFRSLQDRGAEIAVHGYNHVDLNSYSPKNAAKQLQHAFEVYQANGIEAKGFRCPYLSSSDALLVSLPVGLFGYSSNKAVRWDLEKQQGENYDPVVFETIGRFYNAEDARNLRCLPWIVSNLVEIPVSVPDDLQLKDGMGYSQKNLAKTWISLLEKTNQHGEILNLMFHPELASFCQEPFSELLQAARAYKPKVWVARLRDISDWWWKKSSLKVEVEKLSGGSSRVTLPVSSRARWLVRNMDLPDAISWDGKYHQLSGNEYIIPTGNHPFIGVDPTVPDWLAGKLENQGYILDRTDSANECSIFLDSAILESLSTEAAVVEMIESSNKPLIRMWPWPDGYKSALCITGDLDALSLMDYINRLKSN